MNEKSKGILKEFKEFAITGNMVDLAIGVIIGGATGKVVTSIVNDIVMPPIGLLLGGVNFTDLFISLDGNEYASLAEATEAGGATFNYGQFANTVLEFLIIAIVIFILVKQLNRLRRKKNAEEETPVEPDTKECPECLSEVPIKATRCRHCTVELKS